MSGQAERNGDAMTDEQDASAADDQSRGQGEQDGTAASADNADPIAQLQAKVEENWDLYVRAAAELENVRKRAARDLENARKFALERFARELLTVRDSLEMGIDAAVEAGEAGGETLLEGSRATLKQLATTMEQFGVTEVDPLGEPFDPELHEAMTMQPSVDAEPGSILTVFQKGYTLNGRLLRPARVVVAKAPGGEDG